MIPIDTATIQILSIVFACGASIAHLNLSVRSLKESYLSLHADVRTLANSVGSLREEVGRILGAHDDLFRRDK
jgi:hypothetical protein